MACEVTINDIQKDIKNTIIDKFGSSAKPTNGGQAVFISKDISTKGLGPRLQRLEAELNHKYGSKYFGNVMTYYNEPHGYLVEIHPSQDLANAMTLQNQQDELFEKNSFLGSRENESTSKQDFKYNEPVGDNYIELVNWKNSQLNEVKTKIAKQKITLRTQDNHYNREVLKQLEADEQKLLNQLTSLKENKVDYMFNTIFEDLNDIKDALSSSNIHNIEEIRNRLKFYEDFKKSLEEYGDEYKDIADAISRMLDSYDTLRTEKVKKMLENDITIQNTLKELNKDKNLKTKFGKQLKEEGKDDLEDFTIEDLLVAVSDISGMDKNFLGIVSSTTGDTVLPQFLMKEFRETLFKKQQAVGTLIDKLDSFTERTGIKDRDFLFSRDDKGQLDGFLVDVFSEKWFSEYKNLSKKVSTFFNSTQATKTKNYIQVKNWFDKNAHVIDFTRLKVVRDLYGDHEDYKDYFSHTEESMQKYEDNLRMQMGPRYDTTIEILLNKLEKLEEFKEDNKGSIYYEKNLAQRNIWEVLKLWKTKSVAPITYEYVGSDGNTKVAQEYFSHFYDLPILPRKEIRDEFTNEYVDSKFYNSSFDIIKNSKENTELWNIFKEMSEYIDSRYELDNGGRISYPKVEATYAERITDNWGHLKKGKKAWSSFANMFRDTLHEYKGFFYEKGEQRDYTGNVVSNYRDNSKKDISELTKIYQLKGYSYTDAKKKATGEVLSTYSSDLDRNFKALLLEAALHDARVTTEPVAKAILERHKQIKAGDKTRENSIKRLEYFIEKIVLNQSVKERGTKSIAGKNLSEGSIVSKMLEYLQKTPFIKKFLKNQSIRLLSDKEKDIIKHFESLKGKPFSLQNFTISEGPYILQAKSVYDAEGNATTYYNVNGEIVDWTKFNEVYQEFIDYKLKETGLDLNLAGFIDGILKTIILKGLGINPVSGIFNRIEGMHTVMIMDLTGEYWKPGNADVAKRFLSFANTMRMSDRFVKGKDKERKTQIEIFEKFLERMDILQNKKNELQKSEEDSKDIQGWIYKWAVDNPEFKNQGSVILSVLMDSVITDDAGNKHYLFDKETQSFSPFMLENGVLKVRPEFSKFNFDSEEMSRLVLKLESTVSHSQGNYNAYDIMLIKKNWWGRALMLFKTWFPEHARQRWGMDSSEGELNIDLFHNKQVRAGRFIEGYKASKSSFAIYALGALGISYAGLGVMGMLGVGAVSAYVYQKFLRKVSNKGAIREDANTILDMARFLQSTLMESLNYPGKLMSSIPGINKLQFNTLGDNSLTNAYHGSNMSEKEINSLRAMSRELAIMLTFLGLKLIAGSLMYDDDDDKDSPQRKRFNFVQNQLTRSITTLNSWSNPGALVNDNERIGAAAYLGEIADLVYYIVVDPKMDRATKAFMNLTPIPRLITKGAQQNLPWEDSANFDTIVEFGTLPILKWTFDKYKDWDTKGESSAQKVYRDYRDQRRKELKDHYIDLVDGDKERLKILVDNAMREEIGDKDEGASYIDTVERLESEGSLNTRDGRETIVEKLKEDGATDSEIGEYMREIYDGDNDY